MEVKKAKNAKKNYKNAKSFIGFLAKVHVTSSSFFAQDLSSLGSIGLLVFPFLSSARLRRGDPPPSDLLLSLSMFLPALAFFVGIPAALYRAKPRMRTHAKRWGRGSLMGDRSCSCRNCCRSWAGSCLREIVFISGIAKKCFPFSKADCSGTSG